MELTEAFLSELQETIPGDFGIYRLKDGLLIPLCTSSALHRLCGMTPEEFESATRPDAAAIVLPADLPRLADALRGCLESGGQIDCLYRVAHRTRGFEWVRARARCIGRLAGDPVFLTLFTTSAPEKNIYQNLLDHTHSRICVCDRTTHEILYLNHAAKMDAKNAGESFVGKTCHEFIRGCAVPCASCWLGRLRPGELYRDLRFSETRGRWERITGEYILWSGRDAFVFYLDDVTQTMEKQQKLESVLGAERRIVENVQTLGGAEPLRERIAAVLRSLLDGLKADRVRLFRIDPDGDTLSCTQEVCREGVSPQRGRLQNLELRLAESRMPAFRRRETVILRDVGTIRESRPEEYALLAQLGIRSCACAPLLEGDRVTGFLGADNPDAGCLENLGDSLLTLSYAISSALARDRSEQERIASQRRYQMAVEGAQLGVWEYSIRTHRITSPSHSFKRFGVPDVIENVPESILPLFPESEQEKLLEMFRRLEAGEPTVEGDFWMRWSSDMPLRCEHVVYTVVPDESGQPAVAYGLGMDMTARKQEEERYRSARRQLELAHPASLGSFRLNLTKNWCGDGKSPLGFVMKQQESGTADGYFAEFSKLIADPEVKADFHARFTREKLLGEFRNGRANVSIRYPIVYEDGSRHWRDGQLYMLQNPLTGDVEAVTYAIDIDEQKKSELIAERITNENFDYIALIEPRTRSFRLRCGRAESLFGLPGRELSYDAVLGSVGARFVAPEDKKRYLSELALETVLGALRRSGSCAVSYRRIDGGVSSRRNLQFYWLEKPEGEILLVSSNVTAAYEQEQQRAAALRRALKTAERANAMKTEFLSNVSHDMRTPLNAVLGYARLAREADPSSAAEYLRKIEQAGSVLLALINDTLDLSKIETGAVELRPEPVRCSDVLEQIVASVKPGMDAKHIRFTIDNSRAVMAVILADRLRLQEIFINLLSNAVKFTPEGGEITLVVECMELKPDRLRDRIFVRDNGCGMSREFLPKAFEPFSQERTAKNADAGGSGLGLSIVRRLVERMGGSISVKSEPGRGTEFEILLDFARAGGSPAGGADEAPPEGALNGLRVLLCEDNAMNTEIAKSLLGTQGVCVVCAENGLRGCAIFRESAPGAFDAILMDVRMPVLDGCAAAAAIRAMPRPDARTIPILAMTADAYDTDVNKCLAAGMNAHLAKPVDPERLFAELWRLTSAARGGAAGK